MLHVRFSDLIGSASGTYIVIGKFYITFYAHPDFIYLNSAALILCILFCLKLCKDRIILANLGDVQITQMLNFFLAKKIFLSLDTQEA